ncbi:lipid-A-disaccharide synthase [Candidatus Electronema sp. TJ]|uniref:lipid-A-disaccharide synthase n=1 Tax=Candidatus Electronema sp. TJ TaxID=3401573 RepID=UPI003AA8554D
MKGRHVMIVAGEASGDMHGARLVEAMSLLRPGLRFSGLGGRELAAAGVELLCDASKIAVVGITEVFSHLGDILAARKALIKRMRADRPALLILIDYPDFNLLLAAAAKKLGIPVFYYISPQVWAWRSGRVKKIGRLTDRMAVILPFEQDFYARRGVTVDFVGHPLKDTVRPESLSSRADFFRAHDLDVAPDCRVVGLLPGSRAKEIRSLLPDFLAAAELLTTEDKSRNWLFLLPRASTVSQELLWENGLALHQNRLNIRVVDDDRYALMAACDAAAAASGTVTLELAILGVPAVAAYRVSPWTYRIGRLLVRHLRHFSLVNLIARREVIPELLQNQVSPAALAAKLRQLIDDAGCRRETLRGLAEVTEMLGPPGCAERAAVLALSCMTS